MTPKQIAKRLFIESVTYYIRCMSRNLTLTKENLHVLLIGINGIVSVGENQIARALANLVFNFLTVDEVIEIFERAKRAQKDNDCTIPWE